MPECKIPGLSWIYNLSGIIAGACDYFTFFRTYRQSAGFSPAPDHVPCFSGSVYETPGTGLWNAGCPAKKDARIRSIHGRDATAADRPVICTGKKGLSL